MDKYIENRLQKLHHPDKRVRCLAIEALGRVTYNKLDVISPLINILDDPDEDVYRALDKALTKLGEVAVLPVIEVLHHQNPLIRYRAVDFFGKIQDARATEPLINLLNEDEDEGVRAAAAGVLGCLPWDERMAVPLINALKDKASYVRSSAAISLDWHPSELAVQPLIKTLKDEDEQVRGYSASALVKCGGSETIEYIIPLLEDESAFVRTWTCIALEKSRNFKAVTLLIKMLEDKSPEVRKIVVQCLGNLWWDTKGRKRAIEPLLNLVQNDLPDIRSEAAEVLGNIGNKKVLSVLEKVRDNDLGKDRYGRSISKFAADAIESINQRHRK